MAPTKHGEPKDRSNVGNMKHGCGMQPSFLALAYETCSDNAINCIRYNIFMREHHTFGASGRASRIK